MRLNKCLFTHFITNYAYSQKNITCCSRKLLSIRDPIARAWRSSCLRHFKFRAFILHFRHCFHVVWTATVRCKLILVSSQYHKIFDVVLACKREQSLIGPFVPLFRRERYNNSAHGRRSHNQSRSHSDKFCWQATHELLGQINDTTRARNIFCVIYIWP